MSPQKALEGLQTQRKNTARTQRREAKYFGQDRSIAMIAVWAEVGAPCLVQVIARAFRAEPRSLRHQARFLKEVGDFLDMFQ